jgi:hypothetical protein
MSGEAHPVVHTRLPLLLVGRQVDRRPVPSITLPVTVRPGKMVLAKGNAATVLLKKRRTTKAMTFSPLRSQGSNIRVL